MSRWRRQLNKRHRRAREREAFGQAWISALEETCAALDRHEARVRLAIEDARHDREVRRILASGQRR